MSQLKIEDIKIGTGKKVKSGDFISIHYLGTLENGKKFDSSYDRGQPFEVQIGVGYVIQGWDQGVPGMKIGGKRKLTIPSDLGYGSREIPGVIPANSTLIFEVELIDIK
jgi:FKBP-type peptidyl-prolyl cis-trans isomerase FkpA